MKRWTTGELEIAIQLIKNKKNYKEISSLLNRTERSVREKLRKNGHKYSNYNESDIENECLECKQFFLSNKSEYRKFCTNSCSVSFNNKKRIKHGLYATKTNIESECLSCGKTILNKERVKKFCNTKCQKQKEKDIIYKKIEEGKYEYENPKMYKKYLIEKYGEKCMECNWCKVNTITGNVPIQLEHIDGNSKNNNLDNLKLLCPNCHSLTNTYGFLNNGNGRNERKKYRNYLKELTIDELIEEKIKIGAIV